jgi:hypothetical protein
MLVLEEEAQVNVTAPAPPVAVTPADPVHAPGQVMLATVGVIVIDPGWVIVNATVLVQSPPLFWIVTVCVPAHKLVATFVFEEAGLHI